MKKAFLIPFLIVQFLLFSCNNEQDQIKEIVITDIKGKMPNPDSFELVDYQVFKEIKFGDEKALKEIKELMNLSIYDKKDYENYKNEYDFVNSKKNKDEIAKYIIHITAKGQNVFGATIQSKYSYEILNDDSKKILYSYKLK